jgi:hypothetical protein
MEKQGKSVDIPDPDEKVKSIFRHRLKSIDELFAVGTQLRDQV